MATALKTYVSLTDALNLCGAKDSQEIKQTRMVGRGVEFPLDPSHAVTKALVSKGKIKLRETATTAAKPKPEPAK